jgi:hypothetical protein
MVLISGGAYLSVLIQSDNTRLRNGSWKEGAEPRLRMFYQPQTNT